MCPVRASLNLTARDGGHKHGWHGTITVGCAPLTPTSTSVGWANAHARHRTTGRPVHTPRPWTQTSPDSPSSDVGTLALQLISGNRAPVNGVGAVDNAQRSGPGVEVGKGRVVTDPSAPEHLDRPVDH